MVSGTDSAYLFRNNQSFICCCVSCLSCWLQLAEGLFGISITNLTDSPSYSSWADGVQLYSVSDATAGAILGYFYIDLYVRDGKDGGGYTSPLIDDARFWRTASPAASNTTRKTVPKGVITATYNWLKFAPKQLPVVAMVREAGVGDIVHAYTKQGCSWPLCIGYIATISWIVTRNVWCLIIRDQLTLCTAFVWASPQQACSWLQLPLVRVGSATPVQPCYENFLVRRGSSGMPMCETACPSTRYAVLLNCIAASVCWMGAAVL